MGDVSINDPSSFFEYRLPMLSWIGLYDFCGAVAILDHRDRIDVIIESESFKSGGSGLAKLQAIY